MNRTHFTPQSEAEWLALRVPDLTSTMMPALFELSPYCTAFELYHAKKSGLVLPFETNDRIEKGKRIEEYAAAEVAAEYGWETARNPDYIRLDGLRIGSSFDFHAVCPKRGKGILEIKAVDYFQHKEKWSPEEIPAHIEIQARQQMMVADVDWVCVAAFTSIYDYHPYFLERDKEFEAGMLNAAAQFWKDVDAGNEPVPDFYRDAPVIAELYKNSGSDLIDMTEDAEMEALVARFETNKDLEKHHKEVADATKAEIHFRLGDAGGAYTKSYRAKCGRNKDTIGTLVTQDMVGTYIGARKGYRRLDITKMEGKNGG